MGVKIEKPKTEKRLVLPFANAKEHSYFAVAIEGECKHSLVYVDGDQDDAEMRGHVCAYVVDKDGNPDLLGGYYILRAKDLLELPMLNGEKE